VELKACRFQSPPMVWGLGPVGGVWRTSVVFFAVQMAAVSQILGAMLCLVMAMVLWLDRATLHARPVPARVRSTPPPRGWADAGATPAPQVSCPPDAWRGPPCLVSHRSQMTTPNSPGVPGGVASDASGPR